MSLSFFSAGISGCFSEEATLDVSTTTKRAAPSANVSTSTAWTPSITGAGSANHDSAVAVATQELTVTGVRLTGLAQAPIEITVSGITMDTDLGTSGSLSLVAEVTGFPSSLSGWAWPALVSLHDGTQELINVSGCGSGFWDSSTQQRVSGCGPDPGGTLGSAFMGDSAVKRRLHWEQAQRVGSYTNFDSVNSFPTCNWSGGAPKCSFAETPGAFFNTGKLVAGSGVTYTAKYVLLTSDYWSVTSDKTANLKVTAIRKTDSNTDSSTGTNGAVDLNVILVGSENIAAAQTSKGQQNLNALFQHVYDHFAAASPAVKLGAVNVYELGGDAGEYYLDTYYDYYGIDCELSGGYKCKDETAFLFSTGSAALPAEVETKSINVFLVSTISWEGSGTILGLASGIGGSPLNGTHSSGLVVSTFGALDLYNPNCDGVAANVCPVSSQEPEFLNMGSTVSHEAGHFLGLNHPSESGGTRHDFISDTPTCSTITSGSSISISSCRQEAACWAVCTDTQYSTNPYCTPEAACQFNHTMWWTSKNFNSAGQGDGSLFSTQSGTVMNYTGFIQ